MVVFGNVITEEFVSHARKAYGMSIRIITNQELPYG